MNKNKLFQKIYLSSRNGLSKIVSRMVPPHEIEDIVQETYVRICQIENKEAIESPKSFMYKTARNLALDYLKQANVKLVDKIDDLPTLESLKIDQNKDEPYESTIIDHEFSHFCDAVRRLPVQCRRVFVLKKVYGCSQREIAENLNLSESTVEKHIANGMKRCTLYMRNTKYMRTSKFPSNGRKNDVAGVKGGIVR